MNLGPVRRSLVTACVLPLLLTACSEAEPTPQMPDPSPTESSPSASSSETPEPWEEKSEDGAVAFAKHWIDLLNDGRLTGDTEPMMSASTAECKSCSQFADIIATWYAPGAKYQGGPWKIVQTGVTKELRKGSAQFALRIKRPPEYIDTSDTEPATRFDGNEKTYLTTVRWTNAEWRMHEVVIVE